MSRSETEQVEGPLDPVAAAARLAASGLFSEYVLYERDGVWLFGGGVRWGVDLDSDRVTVRGAEGIVDSRPYTGSPADTLAETLAALPEESWRAYGWVGFDFALHSRAAAPALRREHARLARLIVPRSEVRMTVGGAHISGGSAQMRQKVRSVLSERVSETERTRVTIDSQNHSQAYVGLVSEALTEIDRGLYDKVILSRKVNVPFAVDIPATYVAGRRANTPARSFLLDIDGLRSAGFSPELVVTVDGDGEVLTNPLAGTRAAGRGAEADAAARAELQSDPKEIHEHAISVREAVTEMRSVCLPDSVAVSDFMSVSLRGSVQHLASTVRGRLAEDTTPWRAFEALFPAITASGIPKPKALEAIVRLEEGRGLYSGAVVTATSHGELEAALVLRAVYEEQGQAWLRAGAGIVAGSRPEREFEETREKLSSVLPHVVSAS
ncbi:salicylate synthase [Nocardiopsis sp. L17-MgMaSL7]|uniref:salicylate synthase n=1 Tax=Nocardiopsis sp. L17-MgMaSL7 TaxID=1938893 RepID=UPI000D70D8A5|nr:salicylate synthase [Nocardiopsis sp. L17-MgMaSL7]PWV55405.1 salicylate synthetase [Nocardiopsis sp. L17-MgMaSL7]